MNYFIQPLTKQDVERVVEIHIEQFPHSRSTRFGRLYLYRMYTWFLHFQPKLAIVAKNEGGVIGFAVGAIGGYGRRIFRYAILQILIGAALHPGLLFNRNTFQAWTSYIQAFLPQTAATTVAANAIQQRKASLASIAVARSAQGVGVGKALLSAFEEQARQQGVQMVGLSVERDNTAAKHLYESNRWLVQKSDEGADSLYYMKRLV